MKSREEQDKDFEIVRSRAGINCPNCWGRGHTGWNDTTHSYIVCACVLANLEKEATLKAERENNQDINKPGLIQKFRDAFSLN